MCQVYSTLIELYISIFKLPPIKHSLLLPFMSEQMSQTQFPDGNQCSPLTLEKVQGDYQTF